MTTEPQSAPALVAAKMVVGGQTVDAADGQTFEVLDPSTGRVMATAPLGGKEDIDRAVEAARRVRRPQGLVELVGEQTRPDPGQVLGTGQRQPRGARPQH